MKKRRGDLLKLFVVSAGASWELIYNIFKDKRIMSISEDKCGYNRAREEKFASGVSDADSFKSFEAATFEELNQKVEKHLRNKRLVTISCWYDGKKHYAMLSTSTGEVLINGEKFHYGGQAMVSKDGQMICQCY